MLEVQPAAADLLTHRISGGVPLLFESGGTQIEITGASGDTDLLAVIQKLVVGELKQEHQVKQIVVGARLFMPDGSLRVIENLVEVKPADGDWPTTDALSR